MKRAATILATLVLVVTGCGEESGLTNADSRCIADATFSEKTLEECQQEEFIRELREEGRRELAE